MMQDRTRTIRRTIIYLFVEKKIATLAAIKISRIKVQKRSRLLF